ncbi:hypothetical protein MMC17_003523 [Xylographa soralifera]|nr:hypothetical protein [Xylographa soralifera]
MLGRLLLTLSPLLGLFGTILFDFNSTHVLNPRWPPHARFHNGQTMSMNACLALATLYYTHRRTPTAAAARDSLFTAAVFGSLYWVTALSAILYPGSLALDPEYGEGFPQAPVFVGFGAACWVGWWVETRGWGGGGGRRRRGGRGSDGRGCGAKGGG